MVHIKLQNRYAYLLIGSSKQRSSVKNRTLPLGGKKDPHNQDPPSRRENRPQKERVIQKTHMFLEKTRPSKFNIEEPTHIPKKT